MDQAYWQAAAEREDHLLKLPDGRRLGYAVYGEPGGWPLLFFHGTPGSRMMAGLAAPWARERGIWLIAPERPGFGLSEPQPRRRLLDWAADVEVLADHLGLERFAVAGVSGGGPYALACAWKLGARLTAAGVISGLAPVDRVRATLNRSQRVIAALAGNPLAVGVMLDWLARVVRRRPDWIIRSMALVAHQADRKILTRPEVRQIQIEGVREAMRQGGQGTAGELALFSRAWGFEVEEINLPVFLWHGEADTVVPVSMGRYLAGHLARCRARFMPGAGHLWIFEGYPEVLQMLSNLPARKASGPKMARTINRMRVDERGV